MYGNCERCWDSINGTQVYFCVKSRDNPNRATHLREFFSSSLYVTAEHFIYNSKYNYCVS